MAAPICTTEKSTHLIIGVDRPHKAQPVNKARHEACCVAGDGGLAGCDWAGKLAVQSRKSNATRTEVPPSIPAKAIVQAVSPMIQRAYSREIVLAHRCPVPGTDTLSNIQSSFKHLNHHNG